MMPLLNKLFASRKSTKNHSDCRLLVNFGFGTNDRSGLYFGADQVRILLFRECEWRGRKLLFDSVSARRTNNTSNLPSPSNAKQANGTCTRNGAGRVAEHEKVACDDVSLLSEMVFGTVAMTYRGSLFKVHALSAPKCIMCTKVFPAPDHNAYKPGDRLSGENLGPSTFIDSNSSGGSIRNTISHLSSGNFSGKSLSPDLRKNSTCSSTSSGWDIDIPLLGSSQSLESNCSSGFGSLTSLRRRWLRTVSTTLSHSELDEIFGIQGYTENTGNETRENINRRHKTRLGLAVLIQLTPGNERQMEARLLEHSGQLELMLNRLCSVCIESCRNYGKKNAESKGLTTHMRRASNRCILWLLRLLSEPDCNKIPSLWHEVIMNSTTNHVNRTHTLHHNLQQMCQLLNGIDTKSTNFFLSTVVTAVLTHHLGWVQTVMSPHDKQLMENLSKRYPCNPLWAQLGDLYGALGNPPKLVHTVIAGDSEKAALINSVLTFLSYFIRSAIVEKRREYRCPTQQDVKDAIIILERVNKKNYSQLKPSRVMSNLSGTFEGTSEISQELTSSGIHEEGKKKSIERKIMSRETSNDWKTMKNDSLLKASRVISNLSGTFEGTSQTSTELTSSGINRENSKSSIERKNICPETSNDSKMIKNEPLIPQLKRTCSSQNNLDGQSKNLTKTQLKYPIKVESFDEDDASSDTSLNCSVSEKNYPTSVVKIIVNETPSSFNNDVGGTKKRLPHSNQDFEQKINHEDLEMEELTMEAKLTSLRRRTDSGFDSQKFYPSFVETEAFYASLDTTKDPQQSQVFFTLGEETKSFEQQPNQQQQQQIDCNCQCSFAFMRVPSTSAQLPEGVLRKIIQRNFPESSKSIERPPMSSSRKEKLAGACPKCNGAGFSVSQSFEGSKLLLETPTNATEVLRTCGNSVGNRATRLLRNNSLEALMEANGVVELPMPRSKKSMTSKKEPNEISGYTKTLLQRRVTNCGEKSIDSTIYDSGYTSGLVIQGLTKRKRKKKEKSPTRNIHYSDNDNNNNIEAEWLSQLREEVNINARFPVIDQPVSEALCILADLDNWQVGVLSNNSAVQSPLVPVGMSRLVATMLESFAYVWTKYRSPTHCIGIFECKLREMWLRSEALAEMLMAVDACDVTIGSLTKALDLDAADIPLLLAVATTHSPQIAQRFGLSLA